jgi:hypothetical protein
MVIHAIQFGILLYLQKKSPGRLINNVKIVQANVMENFQTIVYPHFSITWCDPCICMNLAEVL